jgi:nicotinate-nucleotide adenylyltransferase
MKVGIFGGTFDPPHVGHLILAQEALAQLNLDQVLWVVTPFPPHKKTQKISPTQDRITMVLLAITGNTKFRLSRVDIDRLPPHFAVDTVALLREKSPKDEFYYLMGGDSLNDLPTWHDPVKFLTICHGIGIMMRCGELLEASKLEAILPGINNKLHFLVTPLIEISGNDIRKRVGTGKQFRYFIPDKIYHYILNHKLYQS